MTSVPLLLSYPHPCSYLDEQAQSLFVNPDYPLSDALYEQLLARGFRRSGGHAYRPHCPDCSACVPARLPVAAFEPDRSQRRILAKNAATHVELKPPVFDPRHYQLYRRYQAFRHPGGGMAESSPEDYLQFLSSGWGTTFFAEFSIAGELAAVAVVDLVGSALSAVYTFFEPRFSAYSPGVYAVLWQLQHARQLALEFVYLGFWIGACRKMAYKSRYRPLQLLIGGQWRQYQHGEALP